MVTLYKNMYRDTKRYLGCVILRPVCPSPKGKGKALAAGSGASLVYVIDSLIIVHIQGGAKKTQLS